MGGAKLQKGIGSGTPVAAAFCGSRFFLSGFFPKKRQNFRDFRQTLLHFPWDGSPGAVV